MKPIGPIPPGFAAGGDGSLMIAGRSVEALVAAAEDTPLFVYDLATIHAQVIAFRAAFPNVALHYALKANPCRPLVAAMVGLTDGIDVASEGELALAQEAGAREISFAGPGKRNRELTAAIRAGVTINLESEGEAARALRIADGIGIRPKLAVRVNPDFTLKGSGMKMGGGAKPFGVDAERVPELARSLIEAGADWRGFHIFAGSQGLDADALIETQGATLDLAAKLAEEVGASPPLVNLGGGFGIPHFAGDRRLDVSVIGAALAERLAQPPEPLGQTRFAIELGRWLVGQAGVYLTRVIDRKVSHGETFLVVDGGLHHQLAASGNFGTVVRRNYPLANASRFSAEPTEQVSVVGCLCTPLDRLGDQVMLPRTEVGDLIAVFIAGAYGRSASPEAFLGHPAPVELLVG
ncbi:pyridoxal-dependent decarboxylase, exosortase A system-associated [Sphingomonas jatrophae]|uniref:Diaminopimelate decarboxylase n=1 Tax=Sphingomonas jatrophae TaxID=1166337 RepID=A0A1I6JWV7_9SPHN|nr:pyridoxal-dependent decarboxylase, exosortase A system-associated [Sphingomonas jatrophae]SFR83447.1 diaminopimelate decarboxylase [Sphingomonas jatrophae]